MPITMTLKVSPDYAAAPCEVSLIPGGLGAVISGGQQHVGLGIVGAYRVPSFTMSIAQEEGEMHPSVVVQANLQEGERLMFAVGVGRNEEAARRLAEQELHERNFDWELAQTLSCWRKWLAGCSYHGPYVDWVQRSILTLKTMTYAQTGAIVAAPTTSLPEELGGMRNWDYRFTWLRNAAFMLNALSTLGFTEEARAFIRWLLRLSYSNVEDLQIMYGIRGERGLAERELAHLSGYRDSHPVRVGNLAASQKQLDVFGEVLDCFERYGETIEGPLWSLMRLLVEHVCTHWQDTDNDIWEVRGSSQHFVSSKVMCWVALDHGIRAAQHFHLEADLPRWLLVRDQIRADILSRGYNTIIQAFTQAYDSDALDASALLFPLVGFISADDPLMRSTVDRISEQLTDEQGFVYRYRSDDGVAGGEGTFTACTLWLVDNLAMQGRVAEAKHLFERVLACAGPLGLFSEETAAGSNIALGNYPQALTHIALINSALNLRQATLRDTGTCQCTLAG